MTVINLLEVFELSGFSPDKYDLWTARLFEGRESGIPRCSVHLAIETKGSDAISRKECFDKIKHRSP